MNRSLITSSVALAAVLGTFAGQSSAAIATIDYNIEYTGAQAPVGASPWLRLTLDDHGGTGSVDLKVEALNLTGNEFVTEFLLNLDPSLNPANLVFSAPTKTGTFANPTIGKGTDAFGGGGGSLFDINIGFDNAPPSDRFGAAEAVLYTLTLAGLNVASFDFKSTGANAQTVSAHVQGIGPDDEGSGWLTNIVPEPTSLAAVAGLGMIVARRARRA